MNLRSYAYLLTMSVTAIVMFSCGSGNCAPQQQTSKAAYAYISNANGGIDFQGSITKCLIAESDGSLSNCVEYSNESMTIFPNGESFIIPRGVYISGSKLYIANSGFFDGGSGAPIVSCSLNESDGSLNVCTNLNISNMFSPVGITSSNGKIYIAARDSTPTNLIYVCTIIPAGLSCNDSGITSNPNPGNAFIAASSSMLYQNVRSGNIPNRNIGVSCPLDGGACTSNSTFIATYGVGVAMYSKNVLFSTMFSAEQPYYDIYSCDLTLENCINLTPDNTDLTNNVYVYNNYIYTLIRNGAVGVSPISNVGGEVSADWTKTITYSGYTNPQAMTVWQQ